jgi:hypothetical protein
MPLSKILFWAFYVLIFWYVVYKTVNRIFILGYGFSSIVTRRSLNYIYKFAWPSVSGKQRKKQFCLLFQVLSGCTVIAGTKLVLQPLRTCSKLYGHENIPECSVGCRHISQKQFPDLPIWCNRSWELGNTLSVDREPTDNCDPQFNKS